MTEEKDAPIRFSAENATKALAAVAIVTYALGTVCINGYLLHLGASDFSLFKARFILTGFSCLIGFLLVAAVQVIVFVLVTAGLGPRLQPRFAEELNNYGPPGVLGVVAGTMMGALLVGLLGSFIGLEDALLLNLAVLTFLGLTWLLTWTLRAPRPVLHRVWNAILLSALWLFGALLYLTAFVSAVLPDLPEQFGGTRPYVVQLAVDKETAPVLNDLGLRTDPSTGVVGECEVLFAGDDFIVVEELHGSQTFVIQRSHVIVIRPKRS